MRAKSNSSGRLSFSQVFFSMGVLVLALAGGCDRALEAYKQASMHLEQGRYEQAVTEFDQALALCRRQGNKPCGLYEARLAEAKGVAAEHFFGQAQKAFAETDLGAAQQHLARAQHYRPGDARYDALQTQILSGIAQAEDLRRRALELANGQFWDQAIETLQRALARYRSMPSGQRDLSHIRHRAYQSFCTAAQTHLAEGDWDSAVAQAGRALTYEPNGRDAKAVIAQVGDYRQALDLIEEARARLDSGAETEATLSLLERARRLYPSHPQVPGLLRRAREAVCDIRIARAEALIDASRVHEALDLLESCHGLLPDYRDTAARIGQVRRALAEHFVDRARTMRQNNLHGNALLDGLLALSYVPDMPQAVAEVHAATVALRQQTVYALGYVGFGAAPRHGPLAEAFDAALLVHLQTVRPPNVVLIDCMPFRRTLALIAGSIVEVQIADPRLDPSRPRDVDALLIGQVLAGDVDVHRTTEYATSTYVAHVDKVPNPEHIAAAKQVEDLTAQLAAAERQLAEARGQAKGTRQQPLRIRKDQLAPVEPPGDSLAPIEAQIQRLTGLLKTARSRLASLPTHTEHRVEADHRYPVVHLVKTARVVCLVRLVDAATGRILHTEQVGGEHAARDRFIQPDPAHGVAGDPLELPDDGALIAAAQDHALQRLYRLAEQFVWQASWRFLDPMRQAHSAGQTEQAVENAVRYLFAQPVRTPAAEEALTCLRDAVRQRNDGRVPKLEDLFRNRCGVLLAGGALPVDVQVREGRLWVTRFRGEPVPPGVRLPCDLITVQGIPVGSSETLNDILSHYGPGQHVTLVVERDGQRHAIGVALVENR